MKREIVLDTETTGFEPVEGHRLVEIGCVELVNHIATGEVFHVYINPQRDMPDGAFQVHGLSAEFLSDKPLFAEVADDFLNFIGSDTLVIHNAPFDMKFLNFELQRLKKPLIPMTQVIDTLEMARQKFPGARASLDALCQRFEVDNSSRTKHGALLDSELLAEVYLELIGGRQVGLTLMAESASTTTTISYENLPAREARPAPAPALANDYKSHADFLQKLDGPLWDKWLSSEG